MIITEGCIACGQYHGPYDVCSDKGGVQMAHQVQTPGGKGLKGAKAGYEGRF